MITRTVILGFLVICIAIFMNKVIDSHNKNLKPEKYRVVDKIIDTKSGYFHIVIERNGNYLTKKYVDEKLFYTKNINDSIEF